LLLVSGDDVGPACKADKGLAWEAYVVRLWAPNDVHEAALVRWRWSRRAAEAAGQTFTTPAPRSPAELELERAFFEKGIPTGGSK